MYLILGYVPHSGADFLSPVPGLLLASFNFSKYVEAVGPVWAEHLSEESSLETLLSVCEQLPRIYM